MQKLDRKQLGVIVKKRGVEGGLVLRLSFFPDNDLKLGDVVFVGFDGIEVPFFISLFRYLTDDTAVISFDDIKDPVDAEQFVNRVVFVELPEGVDDFSADDFIQDQLSGYTVTDKKRGVLGTVVEIVEYSGNSVMIIDSDKKEVMVPFHPDIVLEIDDSSKSILIDSPEGLLELY